MGWGARKARVLGGGENSELLSIHTNYNTFMYEYNLCFAFSFLFFILFIFLVVFFLFFSILFKIFSKLSPVITRTTTLCSCPLFSFKTLPVWQGPTYFVLCLSVSVCQCVLVCLSLSLCSLCNLWCNYVKFGYVFGFIFFLFFSFLGNILACF